MKKKNDIKNMIINCGRKKKYLAKLIGMKPTEFSFLINERRKYPEKKDELLILLKSFNENN
jgi:hypothetical protein